MDVFAPVRDENAAPAELRGGKAFGAGARSFGTPAAKQAGGDGARRAFGDLSNRGAAGPLTGLGKLAAATPRRALGDITNGAPLAAATAAKAAPAGSAACGPLPAACSACTAAFLTEEMVAQAEVWSAEPEAEALAGPSGAAQQAEERRLDEARLQARLAGLFAPEAHAAEDDAAPFSVEDMFAALDEDAAARASFALDDDLACVAPCAAADITFDFGAAPPGDDCGGGFWGDDDDAAGGAECG